MPADSFDSSYMGTPPWDIGRPQPAIIRLADSGQINGRVLDVGCGTGEHVLFLVERGYDAVGIDGAPRAIAKARAKAKARGLSAPFDVADALDLPIPTQPFDTVIDSGLFHVFSDEERPAFRDSLARVIQPGGTYFMMCFSEREPGNWGPRRVTQKEIRSTFQGKWRVNDIQASAFDVNIRGGQSLAWLASITRSDAA
ncbi:MAG TPA: methyltransferase domain-containing protein [Candidatus Dormibacteraeota bacterium]|nr:methyltransferase domain-containing protein [Candidatus Dormibacteraeota bacterium]